MLKVSFICGFIGVGCKNEKSRTNSLKVYLSRGRVEVTQQPHKLYHDSSNLSPATKHILDAYSK